MRLRTSFLSFFLNLLGALYPDGTGGKSKEDDFVVPGGNYTYTWPVRKSYSPTLADSNCLTWIYHSHIDTPRDIASGLIGPLLVCKKGTELEALIKRAPVPSLAS